MNARTPSVLVGAALASLLGACAHDASRATVEEVELSGYGPLDPDEITAGLRNHPPDRWLVFVDRARFQSMAVAADAKRIETYFRKRGFFTAEVVDIDVRDLDGGDAVRLRFVIERGPRAHLDQLELGGLDGERAESARALARRLGLVADARLEYDDAETYEAELTELLAQRGHARAEPKATFEFDEDTGRTTLRVAADPGPVVYYGETDLSGIDHVPESFVRARIAWEKGERFDPDDIELTRARLYDSGLVQRLRFLPEAAGETTSDMRVSGGESAKNELQLGLGFGLVQTQYEVRSRARYQRRAWPNPLDTWYAEVRPSIAFFRGSNGLTGPNVEASTGYQREDFLAPRLRLNADVLYELRDLQAYATNGPSVTLRLTRPFLRDRLQPALSFGANHVSFPRVDYELSDRELERIGLVQPLTFFTLSPGISYDGRDDALAPSKGVYARLRFELGYVLRSEASWFLKMSPELRGYWPVTSWLVLAGRIELGTTLLDLRPIPVTRRYASGGASAHRGFGRGRLSLRRPGAEGPLPLGGEALAELSFEARCDLFTWSGLEFGAVAFADAGDVLTDLADLDPLNLHWAVGPGLRVYTPIGVVRGDLGIRVNRLGAGEPDPGDRFAVHVSVGEAF